ncbi:MAG TPA: hypothetical protein VK559_02740 [Ferruginibacter sp.]|nr:hypothetical protein [Ferruginibacter sp.]
MDIEKHLIYMMSKKEAEQSIDIYYDDLAPEFVVKIKDNLDESRSVHFRNNNLLDSIEQATAFLEAQSNN